MSENTRTKDAKLTAENREESAKLLAFWQEAKKKLGSSLTQAEFGATYGIGEQGMVWQCLNGRGAAISLNAAQGFVRGLKEAAGLNIELSDFSPRLAAEAAKHAQFASGVTTVEVENQDTVRLASSRAIYRLLTQVPDEKLGLAMAAIQEALEPYYRS